LPYLLKAIASLSILGFLKNLCFECAIDKNRLGCRLTTIVRSSILEFQLKRTKHPRQSIERAIQYAESQNWRIQMGGSHAWGKMYCPFNQESCRCGEFCITSIWSTPRSDENHAKALKRVVEKCEVRLFHLNHLMKKFITQKTK